jgi:hypothetical protein
MLERVKNQVNLNPHLKFIKFQKTKDVVYGDGTRATFLCVDMKTQEYDMKKPIAVIKKDRIDDLNIKGGQRKESIGFLGSDIRISCSTEQP